MKKIESPSYKIARRGEDPPSAFQQPYDRPDPYKRYRGTNSGKGYNLTTLFSGPLAGEPESLGWSAVSPTKSVQEGFNTKTHPLSEMEIQISLLMWMKKQILLQLSMVMEITVLVFLKILVLCREIIRHLIKCQVDKRLNIN